jgi:HEAT repeat protein
MATRLEQVQHAANQGNWSQLSQYLQQFFKEEGAGAFHSEMELDLLLSFALAVLDAGEFQDRWEVARVFPQFGTAAIAPLLSRLQDEDADLEVRWFAARILGEFNHPTVIDALVSLLQSSQDEDLNAMAAEALATIGVPAIGHLTALLDQPASRLPAVRSLAQIHHPATISPLLSIASQPQLQSEVRAVAIDALSSVADPRIPPVLVKALNDPAAPARKAAISALSGCFDQLEHLDLVALLADRLWDVHLEVCQKTAIALGRLGTDAAATVLWRGLTSPQTPPALQLDIVRAFGWIGSATALDYLQQALNLLGQSDLNRPVYQETVHVIGQWTTASLQSQATQILIDALSSHHSPIQHPEVKQAIALALGQLGHTQAIDPLVHLLAEENFGVKLHAIAALKSLNSQLAYQRLQALAASEQLSEPLQQGIAIALQEWELSGDSLSDE